MSRHHVNAIRRIAIVLIIMAVPLILFTQTKVDRTKHNAPLEAKIGQGLFCTRWNGLNFSVII